MEERERGEGADGEREMESESARLQSLTLLLSVRDGPPLTLRLCGRRGSCGCP